LFFENYSRMYPFGMQMPGRNFSADKYRYGFNGKEKDKDINSLTAYDYGFRIYNPAIGKFLSVDPLQQNYPELTPYQFASNRPIEGIDLDGLEFLSASNSYVLFFVQYDPKIKKVTSLTVHYDLSNNNRPYGLDEALKSRTNCSNCIGVDAVVGIFDLVKKSSLVKTTTEAQASDVEDPNAVGGGGVEMPKIPQNKAQERQIRKSGEFTTIVGARSARMGAIGATIEITTRVLEWRKDEAWKKYMHDVKWQSQTHGGLVLLLLEFGLENGQITESYANNQSLSQIANYLMSGNEITKWVDNKIVKDEELTKIADSLLNVYNEAVKNLEQNKLINKIQNSQKSQSDNTKAKPNL